MGNHDNLIHFIRVMESTGSSWERLHLTGKYILAYYHKVQRSLWGTYGNRDGITSIVIDAWEYSKIVELIVTFDDGSKITRTVNDLDLPDELELANKLQNILLEHYGKTQKI